MRKQIRNILMFLGLALAIFGYSANSYALSASDCPGAKTASKADVGDPTKPEGSGVFDTKILEQMQGLMVGVYSTLSQISMFGHSLVCYAQTPKLGAYELKLVSWDIFNIVPTIVIWDFSMLLCGVFVFIVGILTSYAIGMYFVDISFKIGFAVLFFPVTIALWPFKPTTQKFMDNLFIVIRNSMLFAMVAITVSFSTELIAQGLKLDDYWALVDMGVAQAGQVKQLYSLSTTKFLVIAFVLIFSFKILTASVEKFLDFFFNDPAFGSESPMHSMGTQAVGMAWNLTGKQALSYANDVAMNLTGKAMIATGNSLGRMSKGDFSDIKKLGRAAKSAGSAVIHPMRTTRRAAQATRRAASSAANSALKAAGTVAKDLHDIKSLFKVGDFYEQEYREKQQEFSDKVDNFTDKGVRNATKYVAAAGIATAGNAGRILRDTAKAPFQSGSVTDRAMNTFSALKGENSARFTAAGTQSRLEAIDASIAQKANQVGQWAGDTAEALGASAVEGMKDVAAAGVSAGSKVAAATGMMDPSFAMSTQQARAALHSGKENAKAFLQDAKNNVQMAGQIVATGGKIAATYVDQHTQGLQKDVADVAQTEALRPSSIIAAPFKVARGAVSGTLGTIGELAELHLKSNPLDPNYGDAVKQVLKSNDFYRAGVAMTKAEDKIIDKIKDDYNSVNGNIAKKAVLGTGKVVIKGSGKLAVKLAKGTGQDAAGALSSVFIGFGKELTNRGSGKSGWDMWQQEEKDREKRDLKAQEDRLYRQSLADKYDD